MSCIRSWRRRYAPRRDFPVVTILRGPQLARSGYGEARAGRPARTARAAAAARDGTPACADVRDVAMDGVLAEHEARGDLAVRQALGEQAEDLALARRQLRQRAGGRGARSAEAAPRARRVGRRASSSSASSAAFAWRARRPRRAPGRERRGERDPRPRALVRRRHGGEAVGAVLEQRSRAIVVPRVIRPGTRPCPRGLHVAQDGGGLAGRVQPVAGHPRLDERFERRRAGERRRGRPAQQPLEQVERLAGVPRSSASRARQTCAAADAPARSSSRAASPAWRRRSSAARRAGARRAGRERVKSCTAASSSRSASSQRPANRCTAPTPSGRRRHVAAAEALPQARGDGGPLDGGGVVVQIRAT